MKWFIKVLRQYADFSGRARRKEYWMFVLFNVIFSYAWMFLAGFIVANAGRDIEDALLSIYLSYYVIMALPGLAVSVRRLHDIGKSGWMVLIGLIPVIGGLWLLVLMLKDGEVSENEYGPNPKTAAEGFNEKRRLGSAGVAYTVAASVALLGFLVSTIFWYRFQNLYAYGQILHFISDVVLLMAGIFLLQATTIREMVGKTKNAMLCILVAYSIFVLLHLIGVASGGPIQWIGLLYVLSVAAFALCNLQVPQNKSLIRQAAVAVIVLSSLSFLWSAYNRIIGGGYIEQWMQVIFSLNALMNFATIALAVSFYPPQKEALPENMVKPATTSPGGATSPKPASATVAPKPTPAAATPKPQTSANGLTLANLKKVRVNTRESEILTMFGQPGFKMRAEEAFAGFGFVPASEKGKVYWTYNTPHGDLQIAVQGGYVVATNRLEYIIEQMEAQLPKKEPDMATKEAILKEDVRFSIESFQPVVTVNGFTKEEAYQMLEDFLAAGNKPQKMSDEETELLKPLFMNLLMHFRNQAFLYVQSGKGLGGMCDACSGSISRDEFYLMGSWARCRKCALDSIVSSLDWNYYLSHIITAIGQVPASIVSQAYDVRDKITERRQAQG